MGYDDQNIFAKILRGEIPCGKDQSKNIKPIVVLMDEKNRPKKPAKPRRA